MSRHRYKSPSDPIPTWGLSLVFGLVLAILVTALAMSGVFSKAADLISMFASPVLALLGSIATLAVIVIVYFIPAAISRKTPRSSAITVANLVFGWTIIGWFLILIWALAENGSAKKPP